MGDKQLAYTARVETLDLNFLGIPHAIAAFLIPHRHGAILIESGPGSTLPALRDGLRLHGFTEADITDVFLTHIHLDHAGASGWLARQGARIHAHPVGVPHLLNPEKLLNSARRIYGDSMETLWGEFLPVPEERLSVLQDGDEVDIDGLCLRAIDTPGHADHHFTYRFGDICFSGDVGGVRIPGPFYIGLPMPPPEFHIEKWRASLQRLRAEEFATIAPTHFGLFDDAGRHLEMALKTLDEVESWIEHFMPSNPPVEEISAEYGEWARRRAEASDLTPELISASDAANPSWMSASGIERYWRKYRAPALHPPEG